MNRHNSDKKSFSNLPLAFQNPLGRVPGAKKNIQISWWQFANCMNNDSWDWIQLAVDRSQLSVSQFHSLKRTQIADKYREKHRNDRTDDLQPTCVRIIIVACVQTYDRTLYSEDKEMFSLCLCVPRLRHTAVVT